MNIEKKIKLLAYFAENTGKLNKTPPSQEKAFFREKCFFLPDSVLAVEAAFATWVAPGAIEGFLDQVHAFPLSWELCDEVLFTRLTHESMAVVDSALRMGGLDAVARRAQDKLARMQKARYVPVVVHVSKSRSDRQNLVAFPVAGLTSEMMPFVGKKRRGMSYSSVMTPQEEMELQRRIARDNEEISSAEELANLKRANADLDRFIAIRDMRKARDAMKSEGFAIGKNYVAEHKRPGDAMKSEGFAIGKNYVAEGRVNYTGRSASSVDALVDGRLTEALRTNFSPIGGISKFATILPGESKRIADHVGRIMSKPGILEEFVARTGRIPQATEFVSASTLQSSIANNKARTDQFIHGVRVRDQVIELIKERFALQESIPVQIFDNNRRSTVYFRMRNRLLRDLSGNRDFVHPNVVATINHLDSSGFFQDPSFTLSPRRR
jgi:hypothetical protein